MATYNKDSFIVSVGTNTFLTIKDGSGKIRYKIYHNTGTTFFVKHKMLQIKTSSENNVICLDFISDIEAKLALNKIRLAYNEVKTNYDISKKIDINIVECIYSLENGNIIDRQNQFLLPSAKNIFIVTINGVNIVDFIFDIVTKILTIDIDILGYEIEDSDLIEIKFFE